MVTIHLFHEFRLIIDSRNIPLSPRESALLAYLTAAAGKKVTAKNYWEIIIKPQKYSYSSRFYSSAYKQLRQTLNALNADEILETGLDSVRFCRINTNAIHCDYYDMLDGRIPLIGKELFLPEYPWAADLYCSSRREMNTTNERNVAT